MQKLILIVDDSDGDSLLLTLMFKRAGVGNRVKILNSGVQAISYLRGDGAYADRKKHPLPAVLFLDLKMPRVDGYEVLDWLQRRPELKSMLVIALSGWAESTDITRAYQMGARSFLSKPCTMDDLHNLQAAFPGHWQAAAPAGWDGTRPLSSHENGGG
ncbi:MAG: putative response regulator, CheY [Pedosphaera sp.]|nr:putative response regulator, CheY [Pedosphaera sp.]